jgi:hypothetical protein
MRILPLFTALILASTMAQARSYRAEILSALAHLETSQAKTRGAYEPGQWPTQVTAILLPSLVGVGRWGKPYPEATIFTTSTIINVLRQIEGDGAEYQNKITPLINRAIAGFPAHAEPPFYNFYPLRKRNGAWVRGPRNFYLAPYFRGLANIPPDADTTSVTYLALRSPVPDKVTAAFARFRDLDRKPHSYDKNLGVINTGAFMTWLMDEKDPKMPRKFGHPELGPRIPFGTNDVDCIINANVLKLLALQGKTRTPGYDEACDLLKDSIDRNQLGTCGIYYPSNYLLPVRVAELKELGGRCTQSHEARILQYVLDTQHPNGSWSNSPPNRPDRIHSTALALNALMMLGDPGNTEHRRKVRNGVEYLLNQSRRDQNGNLYWKGQVFFSAVAQARFSVVWRSSSYTTVLAARALQLAENY